MPSNAAARILPGGGTPIVMRLRRLHSLALLLPVTLHLLVTTAFAHVELPKELVRNGGYIVSRSGTILADHRVDELFVTASTIKLLTALAAIDSLGEGYRFTTSFYLTADKILYVRGSGDPFLTSEYLYQAMMALRERGVSRISGYVLDDSVFALEHELPEGSENSHNPYDAPNGGLAVNFNSISIIRQANGTVGSGEAQTPTMSITREIGTLLPRGTHRININHFPLNGTISPQLRYSAELLHSLAGKAGIESSLMVRRGRVADGMEPLFTFVSPRTLRENIRSCLHYSSNFVANQLLLAAAGAQFKTPATWEQAHRMLKGYGEERLGLTSASFSVTEGSGLSRKNRMTPQAMLRLLEAFTPYRDLLPRKWGALVKSGTMASVYCYAGYLEEEKATVSFAFLLNQEENTRNKLLDALKKALP